MHIRNLNIYNALGASRVVIFYGNDVYLIGIKREVASKTFNSFSSESSIKMLWLCCVITALLVLAAKASNPLSIPSDCKPFNYSICRDILPYNFTRLPNYLKHKTTTAVVEALNNHEYQTLITTNCSSDLVFFLCVLHFPICVQGIRGPVLPCRSLCNKVRRECLPTIKSFNESWPKNIDCDNFPIYEKGVCIKKISLHNSK